MTNIAEYLKSQKREIKLYHRNGKVALYYFNNSDGYWNETTYDSNGNELTYKNSDGYWNETTYDSNGNELTYKNSYGFWEERTFDSNGNQLTYKDSNGFTRAFSIKELTIKEIQKELGYKIKIVE